MFSSLIWGEHAYADTTFALHTCNLGVMSDGIMTNKHWEEWAFLDPWYCWDLGLPLFFSVLNVFLSKFFIKIPKCAKRIRIYFNCKKWHNTIEDKYYLKQAWMIKYNCLCCQYLREEYFHEQQPLMQHWNSIACVLSLHIHARHQELASTATI